MLHSVFVQESKFVRIKATFHLDPWSFIKLVIIAKLVVLEEIINKKAAFTAEIMMVRCYALIALFPAMIANGGGLRGTSFLT